MYKYILLLLMAAWSTFSIAQNARQPTKEDYLRKSRTQKVLGWVCAGTGTALIIGGVSTINNNRQDNLRDLFNTDFWNGSAMVVLGGLVGLGSIPLFIGSSHNAKKAAALSFQPQRIDLPGKKRMYQPALALHFGI